MCKNRSFYNIKDKILTLKFKKIWTNIYEIKSMIYIKQKEMPTRQNKYNKYKRY